MLQMAKLTDIFKAPFADQFASRFSDVGTDRAWFTRPNATQPVPDFSEARTRSPWVIAAPVALSLSSCVTAPLEPKLAAVTPEEHARARFYDELNGALLRDPKTSGSALVMDPSRYSSVRSFHRHATKDLNALIHRGHDELQPPLWRITRHLDQVAKLEESTNQTAGADGTAASQPGGGIRPLIAMQFAFRAYFSNPNPNSRQYVCLAVGAPMMMPFSQFMEFALGPVAPQRTEYTPHFKQALDYMNGDGTGGAAHEAGHCIRGAKSLPGETPLATARRLESAADAFEMLYRIRSGEPDMLNKIEINAQWRRANLTIARIYDLEHDTSGAMRLIIDDLRHPTPPGQPDMRQTLLAMPISALEEKAHDYARRAQLQDYPHLANDRLSRKEKLALSATVDTEIESVSRFVSGHLLLKNYSGYEPDPLPLSRAVRILQVAQAGHNNLVIPKDSTLSQAVVDLYQKQPAIMQAAQILVDDEAKRYPIFSLPVNEPTAPSPVKPAGTPAAPGARPRL